MAQNTTLAIDKDTRDRLNAFVNEYNRHKPQNAKELTAKDFIGLSLDYFQRTGIDFATDVVALPADETQHSQKLSYTMETILRGVVDVNLKMTAIGQAFPNLMNTIDTIQKKLARTADEMMNLTTAKYFKLETEEKNMEHRNLMKLGEVLKAWRIKKNISAYQISQITKINYKVLKNIENGKDVYLRSFLRYLIFACLNDNDFDFMTQFKCWANIHDEKLGLQTRQNICNEIRDILKSEQI